jgi:hypothetical protein
MSLTTRAAAKLSIPALATDSTADDDLIDALILAADRAFARYCGYPGVAPSMESTAYTRDFDGDGTRDLTLDVWPVTAVSQVYDDPTRDFESASYLVSSGDYSLRNSRTLTLKSIASHAAWTKADGVIRVTFTAGYATVPDDLKRLANLAVRAAFDLGAHQGKTSVSQGGVSVGLTDASWLPLEVRQGLAPFRLPGAFL